MYLVDTNVLSEAVGEITRGFVVKRRTDLESAARFAEWLLWIGSNYDGRILPVIDKVAVEWGRLSAGRTRGDADALIAATAIAHGLTVVTRNTKDFADTGAAVFDPWKT